jgi:hypothetical protein
MKNKMLKYILVMTALVYGGCATINNDSLTRGASNKNDALVEVINKDAITYEAFLKKTSEVKDKNNRLYQQDSAFDEIIKKLGSLEKGCKDELYSESNIKRINAERKISKIMPIAGGSICIGYVIAEYIKYQDDGMLIYFPTAAAVGLLGGYFVSEIINPLVGGKHIKDYVRKEYLQRLNEVVANYNAIAIEKSSNK